MRLLIAGANGQLGREISRLTSHHTLLAADSSRMDITDADAVKRAVLAFRPDAVINAAAYRFVDRAESEPGAAFSVNRDGAANLAGACHAAGIPLIHLSTDCVFDGSKQSAYSTYDATGPLGVYGASKLAGEQAVRSLCERHLILRTSWVFSPHGSNFVKKILELSCTQEELRVVNDQRGCPTCAGELASGILHALESGVEAWGTYHFCQPSPTTWHAFTGAIVAEAGRQDWPLRSVRILQVSARELGLPAKRPANSVLDCTDFETTFCYTIPAWSASLDTVIRDLRGASRVI